MKRMHMAVALLAGVLCVACFGQEIAPLASWTFDAQSDDVVADVSGNGFNGKIIRTSGETPKRVPGRTGMGMAFAHAERGCVLIPNLGKHDFSKAMSFEAWIKLDEMVRTERYEILSTVKTESGPGFRCIVTYGFVFFGSGTSGEKKAQWGAYTTPAQTQIKSGVWYHIAGTYDGSVFRVYVDGQQAGESKPDRALTRGRDSLSIGAYGGGYTHRFNGVIDEVKIYDRTLSALEVLQRAKSGL